MNSEQVSSVTLNLKRSMASAALPEQTEQTEALLNLIVSLAHDACLSWNDFSIKAIFLPISFTLLNSCGSTLFGSFFVLWGRWIRLGVI
jgi:hypothetical protein